MHLQRSFNAEGVALGVLRDDMGRVFFTTFEDKPIPTGRYLVKRMPAAANPKHGECFEVQNVPGRTDILFHVGNDERHSDGCILVGIGFRNMRGEKRGIIYSAAAYDRFMQFLDGVAEFSLIVGDPL